MQKLLLNFKTIIKLGILNVCYVFWYRFSLKSGLRKYFFKQKQFEFSGDFLKPTEIRADFPDLWKQALINDAERIANGQLRFYSYHWKQVSSPPNWFSNPFNGANYSNRNLHWTKLPDFSPIVGDIKNIWEASRFEWVVTLSRAYAVTGEIAYLTTINDWLKDWAKNNPLNTGPNWKCGQEAAIRVFNLINAAFILNQHQQPTENITDLIYAHLIRINGNIRYAMAQDNNHGTSEAAGLFIGGLWLFALNSKRYPRAEAFSKKGRSWLENRVEKLIETDGSFSQHSVTYHRVMLDTLCFAEFWRSKLNTSKFSTLFYQKTKAATEWLWLFTDEHSGNAPNLGSNDGALLLNMHSCNYRDFRPSLRLATKLFGSSYSISSSASEEVLYWFGPDNTSRNHQYPRVSHSLKSGYTYIHSKNSWALVRWPYFRFRPSHNDVMHFDLWYNGHNVICDAGTYSYNPTASESNTDLKSVHFHNTVSFDNKEQMPKLGRFLLGNWLKADHIGEMQSKDDGTHEWSGSYTDNFGNRHVRKVSVKENIWQITDTLSGLFKEAVIGFNIADVNSSLEENKLDTIFGSILTPEGTVSTLENSEVSSYYWEKHPVKRLIIKVTEPGTYCTIIDLTTKK
jgi:hypothetical protein